MLDGIDENKSNKILTLINPTYKNKVGFNEVIIEKTKEYFKYNLSKLKWEKLEFSLNPYFKGINAPIYTYNDSKKLYTHDNEIKDFESIKNYLKEKPISAPEYYKYEKSKKLTIIFTGIGITSLALGMYGLVDNMKKIDNNNNSNNIHGNPLASCISLVIPSIIFEYISWHNANKHLKNSINDYNSNFNHVNFNPVKLNFMVNSNGLGVRISF